ncbi:MAG: type II and III secretion system protein [Lentisphaerae bacterium]|nr:type II and III secretion system protein [Lentisphaerota bacterium]
MKTWIGLMLATGIAAGACAADVPPPGSGPDTNVAGAVVISCKILEVPAAEYRKLLGDPALQGAAVVPESMQRRILDLKDADILSAPRMATMPGQSGQIRVVRTVKVVAGYQKNKETGKSEPVLEDREAGLSLTAMAEPDPADPGILATTIDLQIVDVPEQPPVESAPGAVAVVSTRSISTCVRIPNGGTVVLGGLARDDGAAKDGKRMTLVLLSASQGVAPLVAKCRSLVIPQIEFREASIKDVVAFLVERSHQLDPAKDGVNIVLDLQGAEPPLLTLALRNVPLGDALRYVTMLTGLELKYEPLAVVISTARKEQPKPSNP